MAKVKVDLVAGRDYRGRLKCQAPECRAWISGKTGLDEVLKLMRHYQEAHLARLTMEEVLRLRCKWEEVTTGSPSQSS